MENNFENELRKAAKKFRICTTIGLITRLFISPIFFICYIIKNLFERLFDFITELKGCFIKSFIKPIKRYKNFKRTSNEENLKRKIEFQKFREEYYGEKWDGKMDGWREWIGYFFDMF